MYILNLMDFYCGTWNVLIIALFECFGMVYLIIVGK